MNRWPVTLHARNRSWTLETPPECKGSSEDETDCLSKRDGAPFRAADARNQCWDGGDRTHGKNR